MTTCIVRIETGSPLSSRCLQDRNAVHSREVISVDEHLVGKGCKAVLDDNLFRVIARFNLTEFFQFAPITDIELSTDVHIGKGNPAASIVQNLVQLIEVGNLDSSITQALVDAGNHRVSRDALEQLLVPEVYQA